MADALVETKRVPVIFCFVDAHLDQGEVLVVAVSEDGYLLAQHVCSDPGYGPHDLGVTSEWKHDRYRAHYPGGYAVRWVEKPDADAGCRDAIALAMMVERTDG